MFSVDELDGVVRQEQFQADMAWVRQALVLDRIQREFDYQAEAIGRLGHFVEIVLGSAPGWENTRRAPLCRVAGEIAEVLATRKEFSDEHRSRMRFRAALLYELAGAPALSAALINQKEFSGLLPAFFKRKGIFGELVAPAASKSSSQGAAPGASLDYGLSSDALALGMFEQGDTDLPGEWDSSHLARLAAQLAVGYTATEIRAFETVLRERSEFALRALVEDDLFGAARDLGMPPELWEPQVEAIRSGLLEGKFDSWAFAAPTGSGKTFIARLLILKTLKENPDTRILYVVPSKALVNEVSTNLEKFLAPARFRVVAVSPQLVELPEDDASELTDCSVAVLTPEKADMLLRLGQDFIMNASLVIIDEAHHIEADTRGFLLEMYLWRLNRLLAGRARTIFLSAVAPNIKDLAQWMGKNPAGLIVDKRPTRMRAGVYSIRGSGRAKKGYVKYADGTEILLVEGRIEGTQGRQLIQLAASLVTAGPVLTVAKGKKECENLAEETVAWLENTGRLKSLSQRELESEVVQRLDSRLEREMYGDVPMRALVKARVVYHHAGLPPRVRKAVEDLIRAGLVDYVFATTTLAEGVNFPFSSVIVQSLALREPPERGRPSKYRPVTPRTFWNIAGRAGRPGFDREGQVLLFEPSLGLSRISAVLENYLNPALNSIAPVQSAMLTGLREITSLIEKREVSPEALKTVALPETLPRRVKGLVNLLRVGITHAKASNLFKSPEDILESTFAARFMSEPERESATALMRMQADVVDNFFNNPNAPSPAMVAEVGVSIDSLDALRQYVRGLENWQIENMAKVVRWGAVNDRYAVYVLSPVAKRMTELEGDSLGRSLGAFFSEVIGQWLSGVPLSHKNTHFKTLEELISVIYSRIQYLLPWGLYSFDRLVEEEAKSRNIAYDNEIRSLSYLADAGVPNFDALRLVDLDIERTDATRLASKFRELGGSTRLGVDVVGWLAHETPQVIEACIRGRDRRRVDYDFPAILARLRRD